MITGAPQEEEKQKCHSWRAHTSLYVHWDPGGEAVTSWGPGPDLPAGLRGSPGELRAAVAHCRDKDISGRVIG